VFLTLAVALILIVTAAGPHEKRMIPPARTAATTAAEVQLAAAPSPTTRFGCDVSTGRPAAGTGSAGTGSACTPGADRRGLDRAVGTSSAAATRTEAQAIRSRARGLIAEA